MEKGGSVFSSRVWGIKRGSNSQARIILSNTQSARRNLTCIQFDLNTMLAKHVLAVLLSVGASAIPFDKRDASAVLADFNTLSTDLSALGSAISSFDGTLNGALGVQQKEGQVETALKQTVSDVKASTAFSAADSTSVTNAVTGLEPSIVNVLNDLVSKKSGFDSVGVTSIVVSDLNSLHDLTGQLSTELQSKVTSGDASTISDEAARLDAEYKKAIAAYS
ncbi:hypothetical protein AO1008_09224 [Aspergillus oryzae 100-8]|uniref:Cell wall mannoprotein 1 n=1 Tax=Aspergillus oryzae (strain 3.042) TaxID=1160506 RepID=I8IIB2_ASPO3|nr:hypothetical protein Ao3042_05345 [Aspergillus oryzae 3.042]KDE82744.1 hypothetical protein AO1008_09224 [Aspergillus oryzae 100-8]|eukprot:EIT78381.1 hypothetical protein Ao3042_05345 [Aspergillus oryzae 3.042]